MTPANEEQLRYLLALLRIPGIGPVKLSKILSSTNDLTTLFDSTDRYTLGEGKADWAAVDRDLQWAENRDCAIITQEDLRYPKLLKETDGAPPLLFVRGNIHLLAKPQIAMVGSRNPTPMGHETAFKFAEHFSQLGMTITSGLALGIDGAAHKGALLGKGKTVAVMGHGLDTVYPASHRDLAHQIAEEGGVLVSEFSVGVSAHPSHFPRRNRIISGLSIGTLVVEAALNSGSLITAKLALEQGREVFAVPGSIHSPLAKGCHTLIRQGAKLVETAEDVLEELGALVQYMIPANEKHSLKGRTVLDLEQSYEDLLVDVGYDCTPIDVVVSRSGLTPKKVSSMLLELELKGLVVSVPGGYARLLG